MSSKLKSILGRSQTPPAETERGPTTGGPRSGARQDPTKPSERGAPGGLESYQQTRRQDAAKPNAGRVISGGRPTTIGIHVTGLGTTRAQEAPGRFEAAPEEAVIRDEPHSEPLEEAAALAGRLRRAPDALTTLAGIGKRPQRSLGMRALIAVVPGGRRLFTPKSAHELMTGKRNGDVSADPKQVGAMLDDVMAGFDVSLTRHATAVDEVARKTALLADAQQRLAEAASGSDAPPPAALQQAVAVAKRELATAKGELKGAMQGLRDDVAAYQSLDLGVQVLASDLLARKATAVGEQVNFLAGTPQEDGSFKGGAVDDDAQALPEILANLGQQRDRVDRELTLMANARKAVQKCETELAGAREAVRTHELHTLADLADPAHVPDPDAMAATRGRLNAAVNDAERRLARLNRAIEDLGGDENSLTFARDYLDDEIQRMQGFQRTTGARFGEVAADLREAGKGVGATRQEIDTQLEANLTRINALSAAHTRAVAASAPGFPIEHLETHGAALIDKLGKMAGSKRLAEDDLKAERALPRATALEIISRGLAVATAGHDDPAERLAAAGRLADELTSGSLLERMPQPAGRDGEAAPAPSCSEDMTRLLQTMAAVPRGLDALNALAGSDVDEDGKTTQLERGQLEAMQAYWQAHRAQQAETDPAVQAWLGDAMEVAKFDVRNTKDAPRFTLAGTPPAEGVEDIAARGVTLKQQATYRAVRNGFLSNASGSDYDLCNRNLLNLTDTITAQKPRRPVLMRWLPRSINPAKDASPLAPRALYFAQKQMEAQGMDTRKTRLDSELGATFETLGDAARTHLEQLGQPAEGGRERPSSTAERRLSAAIVAVAGFVTDVPRKPGRSIRFPVSPRSLNMRSPLAPKRFDQSKRLYDAGFNRKDLARLRAQITELAPDGAMPPALEAALGARRVSLVAVMKALNTDLEGASDEMKTALGPALDAFRRDVVGSPPTAETAEAAEADPAADAADAADANPAADAARPVRPIEERIADAKSLKIETADDIERFFRPMLETARLRDQVTLTSGGTVGVGIPILAPVTPTFPLSAQVHLISRRKDAFLQLKNPTFAAEIVTGSIVSTQHDARVSVGYRVPVGAGGLTASGNVKLDSSKSTTISTSLRTLRGKDEKGNRKMQQAIDDNLEVLDILLRWRDKTDSDGTNHAFTDPLQAMFALSPSTIVASAERNGRSMQSTFEARAALRGRDPTHHFSAGASVTPLSMRAAKSSERAIERTGYAHQTVDDRNETAFQRGGVAARLGFTATPYKHSLVSTHTDPETGQSYGETTGRARFNLTSNLLELSRELFSNLEKNGATRFPIGDTIGGSVDRVYGTPKDLLAEIEENREDWLIRCLDVLPRAKGADTDTTERMSQATKLLDRFTDDLRKADANPAFQFNIKYEMQPRMSGMVDGLRGIETLAGMQGELQTVDRTRTAADALLRHRASWAPKNMTVRGRGKTSQETGIDFFLRWQKSSSAETSRVALAFPI